MQKECVSSVLTAGIRPQICGSPVPGNGVHCCHFGVGWVGDDIGYLGKQWDVLPSINKEQISWDSYAFLMK